jgi:uncharacterized protein (TIGR02246 family)
MPTETATASADEAAIRQIVVDLQDAWNRRDADTWAAAFDPDSDHLNLTGLLFEGRQMNRDRHAEIFAGMFKNSDLRHGVRRLRFLNPDIAVVDLDSEMRISGPLPPVFAKLTEAKGENEAVLRTRMRHVMVKRPYGWQIVASQNTPLLSLPATR